MRRKRSGLLALLVLLLFGFVCYTPSGAFAAGENTNKGDGNNESFSEGICHNDKNKTVDEVIALKAARFSEKFIGEMLAKNALCEYGDTDFTAAEMKKLKDKFDEDFIEKWAGAKQYVTIGAAAVYLADSNKVVGAAILRILTPPRSYYSQLNLTPWSGSSFIKKPKKKPKPGFFQRLKYNIDPDHYDAWIHRIDLNFGVTSPAKSINDAKAIFILAGLSYQIHRAAFLNAGFAFSTTGSFSDSSQAYMGITVDSNLLKSVGLLK